MVNPYYTASGNPGTQAPGASSPIRSEYLAIQAAFDKVANFTGKANYSVVVNPSGTGLDTAALRWAMGAFVVDMAAAASVSLTLPALSGILAVKSQVIGQLVINSFTANGTWNRPGGHLYSWNLGIGGGGGGGSSASPASFFVMGGGGGGGALSFKEATSVAMGASQAVTVGAGGNFGASGANPGTAGGDTSVGTVMVAKGGGGGPAGTNGNPTATGGAGGPVAGSTGDFILPGLMGGPGVFSAIASGVIVGAGAGGASPWGGPVWTAPHGTAAVAGVSAPANSGCGGSAAWTGNGANANAGQGGSGQVIIIDFVAP